MAKVTDPRLAIKLPEPFRSRLDRELSELYSQLPPQLAARILDLVIKVTPCRIHPNRVLKFAYLYARAELRVQVDAASREHTRRAKLELAGEIHGLPTGYQNDAEAERRYRDGRRARHQIKSSLEAVVRQWRRFEQVVQQHRSELPVHVQPRYCDALLQKVGTVLQRMGIATVLDEENLASQKGPESEPSAIAQSYIWWHLKMAPYRGKWNDMHQLAFAWRMTPAPSIRRFRSAVYRICKGLNVEHQVETPWESVLSEKA